MPKSDTWPGGIGLETMTGMDSAGSCDSVLSANSIFVSDLTLVPTFLLIIFLIVQNNTAYQDKATELKHTI